MKKFIFSLLFLACALCIKSQVLYTHSNCTDPYCLGLLATVGVNFNGQQTKIITVPTPPEGVKEVVGACNPQFMGCSGSTFKVLLTFDESVIGDPDACFAVITNAEGYGTSPEHDIPHGNDHILRELIYHVEIVVMK